MKVIICGGRDFTDYTLLKTSCDKILSNASDIIILSGRCDTGVHTFTATGFVKVFGADGLGERYAYDKGYPVQLYSADWLLHGKSAGPIRNQQMADSADALIAFWDGKSRGTEDMIRRANAKGLKVRVVRYNNADLNTKSVKPYGLH